MPTPADINCSILSGRIIWRDLAKYYNPDGSKEPTQDSIWFIPMLIACKRFNGRRELVDETFRVTVWSISEGLDACLTVGTQVILKGQLKSRSIGTRGTLTAELTVKANEPGALLLGKHANRDLVAVNRLPDVLRQLGIDLAPGQDQEMVELLREAIDQVGAPPTDGPGPNDSIPVRQLQR
jgi:hypothetical protein